MNDFHEGSREVGLTGIDAVIFDWDGTVIDSVPPKLAQNQALAAEFGNILSSDEVRVLWNDAKGFPDLMQKLCRTDDMDAIMPVVKRDYDKPEFAKRSFDFGADTVRVIREMGKRTALITNVTREILGMDATSLGFIPIETHFDYTQTADEGEYKKPDPRVFGRVLELFGIAPERAMYVGDELKDYYGARDAGMQFVGVQTGMATAEEFTAVGANSVPSVRSLISS